MPNSSKTRAIAGSMLWALASDERVARAEVVGLQIWYPLEVQLRQQRRPRAEEATEMGSRRKEREGSEKASTSRSKGGGVHREIAKGLR